MANGNQYFKIKKERQNWLGIRFFRVNYIEGNVVQVCVAPGEERRGRGNMLGICVLSKITFFSNYLSMIYVQPCTRAEYNKQFEKVVKILR